MYMAYMDPLWFMHARTHRISVPQNKNIKNPHTFRSFVRRKVVEPNGDWNLVIWENFQAFQVIKWGTSVCRVLVGFLVDDFPIGVPEIFLS